MLKGAYKALGEIDLAAACAVIDNINISGDGMGYAHVNIYARPPKAITQDVAVDVQVAGKDTQQIQQEPAMDVGPIIEHFTVSGIDFSGTGNVFDIAYAAIKSDERLVNMAAA